MELPVKSTEATWIIDALVWGAKNLSVRDRVSKGQAVLIVAGTIERNPTAVLDLCREVRCSEQEAESLLCRAKIAAWAVALDYNEHGVMEVIDHMDATRNI